MRRMIDTHCHVNFHAFKDDMEAVIRRSLESGVLMIAIGTQKDTSRKALEVAETHDGVWASVGEHPSHLYAQEFHDADEVPEIATVKTRGEAFDADFYIELAKHPKCVAIGECGLDFYRLPEYLSHEEIIAKQKEVTRAHFDIADEVHKPLIIHCRDAHKDQAEIIEEYVSAGKIEKRGVIHCFTGTMDEAQRYLDLGFLISFTGIITFPPRKGEGTFSAIQHVVRELPLEKIMIETDAPYLAPVPHRGERNEPAFVVEVARKIAEIKNVTLETVVEATTRNAEQLFGIR